MIACVRAYASVVPTEIKSATSTVPEVVADGADIHLARTKEIRHCRRAEQRSRVVFHLTGQDWRTLYCIFRFRPARVCVCVWAEHADRTPATPPTTTTSGICRTFGFWRGRIVLRMCPTRVRLPATNVNMYFALTFRFPASGGQTHTDRAALERVSDDVPPRNVAPPPFSGSKLVRTWSSGIYCVGGYWI